MLNALIIFQKDSAEMMVFPYSPLQRLEANESPLFVDVSGCVAAVAHRNFYSEVELFSYFFLFFSYFFSFFSPLFPQLSSTQSLCRGEQSSLTSQIVNPSQEGGVTVLCRKYVVNLKREITVNKEI